MPIAPADVFSAHDFRNFTRELDRLEKLSQARPHFPEALWLRALLYADCRHSLRTTSKLDSDRDARNYPAPVITYHEKLYDDSLCAGRMNGKPLRLVSA